jgi:hypothetical protein
MEKPPQREPLQCHIGVTGTKYGSVYLSILHILSQGKKFSGRPMCTLLTNKRYELLYNCGIQLLHVGRPLAAFECLIEAVQVYHANPRLWLRLAECCIAANKGVSAA